MDSMHGKISEALEVSHGHRGMGLHAGQGGVPMQKITALRPLYVHSFFPFFPCIS